MQLAYFDESGIDGSTGITLISGFVGNLDDWPRLNANWRNQLAADGLEHFHYKDCVDRKKQYAGWAGFEDCSPHLQRMAKIIHVAPVAGISAGFLGNWGSAISQRPDLAERFPSAYSFCFEAVIRKIRLEMHEHGQPEIILVMSRQNVYQRRALDVWNWHRARGHWNEIKDVTYAEPRTVPGLEMADMLAYETHRHLFKKGEAWRDLPLLSQLVAKQEQVGRTLYDVGYDEAYVRRLTRADSPGD